MLRREQFRLADDPAFCLEVARTLVAGKIRNQRVMLQRNHVEPPSHQISLMKQYAEDAENAESLPSLLGIEGNAARAYFGHFAGMLKPEDPDPFGDPPPNEFPFDFTHRNRRPPKDPVNALLSLAYAVLAKDLTIVCAAVGFDPFLGFYHQPRFGRASLALDLMEPFRPLIADSAVLSVINTRMVTPRDFIRVGPSVALKPEGRKAFFRAYEQRMDTLVTHPLFQYRLNYRRMLEIQTRLLARVVTKEMTKYPVFTTR
jgi:CRISPR-associated protein Cas1